MNAMEDWNFSCMQPPKDDPYVQETEKLAEIKDHFGKTRFKVALTDYDHLGCYPYHDDLRHFDERFQVTVISYCHSEEPLELVSRNFRWIDDAKRFYGKMVSDYSALAKAETRDYQDIKIYARKTGYRKICPECCATCRFAIPVNAKNCLFDDWKSSHRGKFLCSNSKLYEAGSDRCADRKAEDYRPIDVRPEVEFDCVCDGYERRLDPKYRNPAHSNWAFENHDMQPDMRVETIATATVGKRLKECEDNIVYVGGGEAE